MFSFTFVSVPQVDKKITVDRDDIDMEEQRKKYNNDINTPQALMDINIAKKHHENRIIDFLKKFMSRGIDNRYLNLVKEMNLHYNNNIKYFKDMAVEFFSDLEECHSLSQFYELKQKYDKYMDNIIGEPFYMGRTNDGRVICCTSIFEEYE